ncbi:hypothetical protein [Massilia sp. PWRC2]|uniref:hypothetical protein n=1 Tax=Massilia sp. PWRC2 TaxID=2804626 RepID=UPI003CEFAC4C
MRHHPVRGFATLQAHGGADIGSVYAPYPMQRSRLAKQQLPATLEHKRLSERTGSIDSLSAGRIGVIKPACSGRQSGFHSLHLGFMQNRCYNLAFRGCSSVG